MMHTGDRAIVIGLGEHGASVTARAQQRWTARPANGQRLAWLKAPTPNDALQGLPAAVNSISRLRSDALLGARRLEVSGPGIVRVLVVCTPAEVTADEVVVVARATRRVVEGVADVRIVGMVILPETALGGAPPSPLPSTRERLGAWLMAGPTSTAPLFDGGCLCVGAANQGGFTVSAVERDALAAELVVQWLSGPLDDSYWPAPASGGALTSAGVAVWVYPLHRLQAYAADRTASQLLDTWLEPVDSVRAMGPARGGELVAQYGLSCQLLGEEVAPSSFLGDLNIQVDGHGFVFRDQWRDDYAALENQYHTRLEALIERRALQDKNISPVTARVVDAVISVTMVELDEPAPGRLLEVGRRLTCLSELLSNLKQEANASAERRFAAISHLEAERDSLAEKMNELAEQLPRDWMRAVGWLFLPWRLWRAYQATRAMRALAGSVAVLLQQCLAQTLDIMRDDACQTIYSDVAEQVANLAADVQRLTHRLKQAREQLEPWEDGLLGVFEFPTECSLLTPELMTTLTEPLWQDRGFMLREAGSLGMRLSAWLDDPPSVETIVNHCVAYGRQRSDDLAKLTAEELFARRFPTPSDREEALQNIVAAAAPFLRWDEARASDTAGSAAGSKWLMVAQGEASTLFTAARGVSHLRAIASRDATRITAVQIVQGVALDAVILDEEVDDGVEVAIDVAVV